VLFGLASPIDAIRYALDLLHERVDNHAVICAVVVIRTDGSVLEHPLSALLPAQTSYRGHMPK
jgi:hypothetical protein